jgi:hypothetical protein
MYFVSAIRLRVSVCGSLRVSVLTFCTFVVYLFI